MRMPRSCYLPSLRLPQRKTSNRERAKDTMARHIERVRAHAGKLLQPAHDRNAPAAELIPLYKSFLKKEEHRIRLQHRSGLSGLEVCRLRSDLLDVVLQNLFAQALEASHAEARITLVATGGYGRALLNPGSDVDLHFLHPERGGREVSSRTREVIEKVLYMLWDVGFKVGHAVRSLKETYQQALKDHQTMCALIESRCITGDQALFDDFEDNFRRQCITGHEKGFLAARVEDLRSRHAKSSDTVYLQEPNVKSSCGALRDYHNMIWVSWVKLGIRDLDQLVGRRIFSEAAGQDIRKAHDFLLRVRNDMHYSERRATDLLTLRLGGVVAKNLGYEGRRIVQRCEAFMRDYYHHARNLYQHNLSLMERFELERVEKKSAGLVGFLAERHRGKAEQFEGFTSRGQFIFPASDDVFKNESGRLMQLFQQMQLRDLKLSPPMRQLVKEHWGLINSTFRYRKVNRETWEAMLSRKGQVGLVLRNMHRVGFLGRYMPEFGPLTDLVQHEFFHRYTADEHTLKCVDKLDELSHTQESKLKSYQQLFHDIEDPFILYMALLLHDTGRAANSKHHEYASTEMADQACRRLQITDRRRALLLFLVDNHLLLWRTATTRNLEDPEVIAEFAGLVRSQAWLDALFLHTYADSRGTNDTGWTDWKESLVRQLYGSASAYLRGQEAFTEFMMGPPGELLAAVSGQLDASYTAEVAAHFGGMPARYFNCKAADQVILHIRTCRQFFRQLRKEDAASVLQPVLRWVARPGQGFSEVILISWDRHLLLAKVAGALAAGGLNILSADLFLRSDGVVIDLFRVCTTDFAPVEDEALMLRVNDAISKACAGEGSTQLVVTAATRAAHALQSVKEWEEEFPQRVYVSNQAHRDYTLIEIQAVDRLGLLSEVFQAIGDMNLEITQARICTERGAAIDSIGVTESSGQKLSCPVRLAALKQNIQRAVGIVS